MKCPNCNIKTDGLKMEPAPEGSQGHCDLCGNSGVLFFPQKEVTLFGEICMMIAMQAGHGYETKNAEMLMEMVAKKASPYESWNACSKRVKGRIELYCRKEYLPFDKWILFVEQEGIRRHDHPGKYTLNGTLRKTVEAIAKNKADVMHTIEVVKATGAVSVTEVIEILLKEIE